MATVCGNQKAHAGETYPFGMDFTNWLLPADSISSITSVAQDSKSTTAMDDITISDEQIDSSNGNIILCDIAVPSNAVVGGWYDVKFTVVTTEGTVNATGRLTIS